MFGALMMAAAVLPLPCEYVEREGFVKNPEIIEVREESLPPEGYRLDVGRDGARLFASTDRGAFYGRMTLRQLTDGRGTKCCTINDWPAYPMRIVHIDEGRHFFGKKFILRTLELMSEYKLNTLLWHLTEDQGWRIQIDRYPNMMTYGATRNKTAAHGRSTGLYDDRKYGPYFYTKAEIREVVARAKELQVDVIPVIEMPGHSRAVVAAYPELGCPAFPLDERACWSDWGICDDGVCAGNDDVIKFYCDVIDEVCELFPDAEYIHMGGDERTTRNWAGCAKCQARKKVLGLKSDIELQGWMTDQIMRHLRTKGKKYAGFGSCVENGSHLPTGETLVMCASTECGHHVADRGYKVVMAPVEYSYWDFNQCLPDDPCVYGSWNSVSVPANQVFSMKPRTDVLPTVQTNVVGAVGYNWSEYTYSASELEWKIWPRAIAFAQALWHPMDGYAYGEVFAPVLERHVKSLRARGVNCAGFYNGYRRARMR